MLRQMKMKKNIAILVVSLVVLAGVIGTWHFFGESLPLETALPNLVVDGATDVAHRKFSNHRQLQIDYNVQKVFPNKAITDRQVNELKENGWLLCKGGTSGEWDSYIESGPPSRLIHQHVSYWKRDGRLLTIAMQYVSHGSEEFLQRLKVPNIDQQRVIILVSGAGMFAWAIEYQLGISCP